MHEWDSVVGIATRYRAGRSRDRIPVGARFSSPVQTGCEAHPASYTLCTVSFLGVKRPGCSVEHPTSSNAEVNGRVELYFYSPSGPSWPVLGWTLPLPFFTYGAWRKIQISKPTVHALKDEYNRHNLLHVSALTDCHHQGILVLLSDCASY